MIKRKLLKLLHSFPKDTLETEARHLIQSGGLPQYIATDPLYFVDVLAAYRAELDIKTPIDGLEHVYHVMSRKGGDSIIVHNFKNGPAAWSLVTNSALTKMYGAMVARQPYTRREQTDVSSDHVARETRNYKLKPFQENQLGSFFQRVLKEFNSNPTHSLLGIYSPSHPEGREQKISFEQLMTIKDLGKEPVAIEFQVSSEHMVRVSGSGNRISVVVNTSDKEKKEQLFQLALEELDLSASEFAF